MKYNIWKTCYILILIFVSCISSFSIEPFREYHQGQYFLWWEDLSYIREDYQWYIFNTSQPSKLYRYDVYQSEEFGGLYQTEISQLLEIKPNNTRMPFVGLIDSGCFTNHIELDGMIIKAINFIVGQDPNDISDPTGHGTAMAGVISAKINGEGIQGIANAPILLTKTRLSSRSSSEINEVSASITWLVNNGARVIILPWGTKYYNEKLYQACLYASEYDVVIVCSLPNENGTLGVNSIDYPSSFNLGNILSVYNIDRNGSLYHSMYSSDAIGSPGRIIVTLAPNNWYTYTSGTSISAGIAGSVAIVLRSIVPNAPAFDIVAAMKLNYNLKAYQSAQALLLLYPQTNNTVNLPIRYNPPFGSLPTKQLKEKECYLNKRF